ALAAAAVRGRPGRPSPRPPSQAVRSPLPAGDWPGGEPPPDPRPAQGDRAGPHRADRDGAPRGRRGACRGALGACPMSELKVAAEPRTRRKVRDGVVVSDRMRKTIVVVVQEFKPHPLYKKVVRRSRRFKVHDEAETCRVGDRVRIAETRPLSKDKRWRVAEILEKAK